MHNLAATLMSTVVTFSPGAVIAVAQNADNTCAVMQGPVVMMFDHLLAKGPVIAEDRATRHRPDEFVALPATAPIPLLRPEDGVYRLVLVDNGGVKYELANKLSQSDCRVRQASWVQPGHVLTAPIQLTDLNLTPVGWQVACETPPVS